VAATSGVGASAVVWRGCEVLLVRGKRPDDPEPVWILPGGQVEDDELAHEAAVREVREEAGITLDGVDRLLFVSQHDYYDHPRWAGLYTAFTFEARVDREATPRPTDPHGVIDAAEFVPPGEAIRRLSQLEFGPMRDPVIAHLRGQESACGLWVWRLSLEDDRHRPLAVIPLQTGRGSGSATAGCS
jgi:8-oxo-dGTP diphosphatase